MCHNEEMVNLQPGLEKFNTIVSYKVLKLGWHFCSLSTDHEVNSFLYCSQKQQKLLMGAGKCKNKGPAIAMKTRLLLSSNSQIIPLTYSWSGPGSSFKLAKHHLNIEIDHVFIHVES